jgi:sarcosine oxidase
VTDVDHVDAIVIGAGAMGSAAARSLAARGVGTVLLEQFRVGHGRGSSHGATRIFRLSYDHPDYVRMARSALEAWRELEAAAGEQLLVRTGGLDAGWEAEVCGAALESCGVEHAWLSPEAAAERFPGISFVGFERVLHQADAGVCLAERTVAAQVRLAVAAGAALREDTPVLRLRAGEDAVTVETPDGSIAARVVVLTAGPWASRLLADLGRDVPLRPTATSISHYERRDAAAGAEFPIFNETAAARSDWYAYVVPDPGPGRRVKVGQYDATRPEARPDDGPVGLDPERVRSDAAYARHRLPGLHPAPVAAETCLYTMTPDVDFVIDRVGRVGHGGRVQRPRVQVRPAGRRGARRSGRRRRRPHSPGSLRCGSLQPRG